MSKISLGAKRDLIDKVIENMSDVLTIKAADQLRNAMAQAMDGYDVENTPCANGLTNTSKDMLAAYISAKTVEGKSAKTLERYKYVLKCLLDRTGVSYEDVTVNVLRAYLTKEKERGISDITLRGYRFVFRSFFNWLHAEEYIKRNPTANLSDIKHKKEVKLPFSSIDIEKIKEVTKNPRDMAIISFLLSTGCRVGEVTALNIEDVNLINKEVTVLGKGNKERKVFLDDVTVMMLRRYYAARKDNNNCLFVNRNGNRLANGGLRMILKDIEERSGVSNVHPHRFRRTLATNLINHGMPVQDVAAILGHEDINTTMTYVYQNSNNTKNSYYRYA